MSPDILDQSSLYQLAYVFSAGLLTVLTPCVYPLIPITLAVVGIHEAKGRLHAFLISAAYFLGIVLTYSALGLISAQAGIVFGSLFANQFTLSIITAFLVTLALNTLDVFQFNFLHKLQHVGSKIGGSGYAGSFLMGIASGLVAAPCVGPILVTILVVAANSESTGWGGILLFTYSCGLGLPFLILGTFSSLVTKLPGGGLWLNVTKFIAAIGILLTTGFLHRKFLNGLLVHTRVESLPLALGAFFAFGLLFGRLGFNTSNKTLKVIASLLVAVSIYSFTFYEAPNNSYEIRSGLTWLPTLEEGLRSAKDQNQIIMVDLFADWCGACQEFDAQTFSQKDVQENISKLTRVRIDFTDSTEYTSTIAERFSVEGLPCILFLSADGTEIKNSRVNGFMLPQEFIKHVREITGQ